MRAVIVFESEFGATRLVAEQIQAGIGEYVSAELVNVHDVATVSVGPEDLLVVGAPTHARGLPSSASRADGAAHRLATWRSRRLEPEPLEPGVREWLESLELDGARCAAFTTRAQLPRILSGSASPGIRSRLRRSGGREIEPPQDFLVDREGSLVVEEAECARDWGRKLGVQMQQAYTAQAAQR